MAGTEGVHLGHGPPQERRRPRPPLPRFRHHHRQPPPLREVLPDRGRPPERPGSASRDQGLRPLRHPGQRVRGGMGGQAGAMKLGIARALKKIEPALESILRAQGLLTRDPRMKERKKYGLRGARRGVQYSKR